MSSEPTRTGAVINGMNRYRAWIDGGDFRVLLASWLLSAMVIITLNGLVWTPFMGWWWGATVGVALIPLEVYLGIAQMTALGEEP